MKKIPSVFQRNYEGDRLIRDEVTPGCEWVIAGEGIPTAKVDGTACMVQDGALYKRYDAKKGKTPPPDWLPCEAAPDANTGHWPGWLPVGDSAEDRWHREAFRGQPDGTYELVGPKIQGNPHGATCHQLLPHGACQVRLTGRTFEAIREHLAHGEYGLVSEGVVFHHPDGRMAKVKRRDFGLPWPLPLREEKP